MKAAIILNSDKIYSINLNLRLRWKNDHVDKGKDFLKMTLKLLICMLEKDKLISLDFHRLSKFCLSYNDYFQIKAR